jgi:phosphatidylinositol glycan class K
MLRQWGKYSDDRIILMMADDYANSPRNPYKNFMTSSPSLDGSTTASSSSSSSWSKTLYDDTVEIDYRGEDVTVENLARVLAGQAPTQSPHLPVLPAHAPYANILLYVTGHGGDSFFKFQDVEEVLATDLAALVRQRTSHRFLFIADTCQAFTLGDKMEDMLDDHVVMIGSSLREESSYAHHSNADVGLALIERYTHAVHQHLQAMSPQTRWQTSLHDALVKPYSFHSQRAHIGMRPTQTNLTVGDFFINRAISPTVTPTRIMSVDPIPTTSRRHEIHTLLEAMEFTRATTGRHRQPSVPTMTVPITVLEDRGSEMYMSVSGLCLLAVVSLLSLLWKKVYPPSLLLAP